MIIWKEQVDINVSAEKVHFFMLHDPRRFKIDPDTKSITVVEAIGPMMDVVHVKGKKPVSFFPFLIVRSN